ncbi:MAG: 2-phosphosulfolactate phosphatase family protein [Cyanobacteria bacterium P01_A01_bin.84]
MKIFVYNTPESTPQENFPECAIAVDVLRATTTIATALDAGGEAVQVFSDLEKLKDAGASWTADKRLLVGERGGNKVPGFDLGNSPLDCTPECVKGKRLFMSTTNGTRALKCIQDAKVVLTGAFINKTNVVEYLLSKQPETVWIVGSGWEGTFSLEDTACAGAIASGVSKGSKHSLSEIVGNDETIGAIALYSQWQNDLLGMFHHASHGKRLLRLDGHDDLKYCCQIDTANVLPMQSESGVLKAVIR